MKSLKNYIIGSLICLLFLLFGGFFVGFYNNFVFAEEIQQGGTIIAIEPLGNGTENSPYIIQNSGNLKFVAENIDENNYATGNYILQSSVEIDFSIGTEANPFKGVFNGNGKTITVRLNGKPSTNKLGLFAFANGATIKNLAVDFNAVLESETQNEKVVIGGIVGSAVSTTIEECYCNFSLSASKIETLNENEIKNFYVQKEEGVFETFKYNGEIVAGGLVGEANSIKIKNSYSVPEIKIYQTSNKQAVIGGIVGNVSDGEIRNVYVAPSTTLSQAIANKNGVLTAVEAKNCQIVVNSNESEIVVGGIAGVGSGGNLIISNTLFAGMISSSQGNLVAGGIVGKIPENKTFWPKQIEYGKFVGISNLNINVKEIATAVGNQIEVAEFIVPTSVSAISSLPTLAEFKGWSWNIFDSWDFENVWKEVSIINQTQGFFPMLQGFSTFKIQVATNKVVAIDKNGKYLSGYLTFKINGEEKTSLDVTAGAEVAITATFHEENGNELRNFKNYFMFTNWLFNEVDVKGTEYSVVLNNNGTATLTFKASSKTEGIYDIGIKGKPVEVNVSIKNTNEQDETQNIGSVLKNGTEIENLTFEIQEYLNGELISLKALGTEFGDYIFDRWEDSANNFQTSKSEIVFELNNEKASSSSRVYPVVKYDEVKGKLVANLNAYFSNNTSKIKFEIVGNGKININETEIQNGNENSFVNQKQIQIIATPNEENEFVGWFIGNEKVSGDLSYSFIVSENVELTAKFKPIEKKEAFVFPVWAIILVVVAPILLGGIIALIVIKVKKGKRGGYRKHYF